MSRTYFTVDNIQWQYPVDITRVAEMRASDVSGLMLDGSYYNDVLGTFMSYTIKLIVPTTSAAKTDYITLYEKLTEPVDGHNFVIPYNGGTVQITGRVENISDVYVRLPSGNQMWRGIQFTVNANNPTKQRTLAEIIASGLPPMPASVDHDEGDTWIWHNGAWVLSVSYEDADTKEY